MPDSQREPNAKLGAMIDEAGMTALSLARRIAALADEWGLELHTAHTQVARWRAGQLPRPDTQLLIAEVISRKLSRPVALQELGFEGEIGLHTNAVTLLDDAEQAVQHAAALWDADVSRREFIHSSVAAVAVGNAALSWLLSTPSRGIGGRLERGKYVTSSDVESVRATTAIFAGLDNKFGGRHARMAAVQYLDDQVAPLLRGRFTEQVGKELFAATSELTLCVAWMAYDGGQHHLARRYFLQALSLARHAGERRLGASVLSALSHQANHLHDLPEARDLARAARHAVRDSPCHTLGAQFAAMEARAQASLGARQESLRALGEAEDGFAARKTDDDPPWILYFDEAELAAEVAHCHLNLGAFAEAAAALEQHSGRDGEYTRSNAFAGIVHLESLIGAGELERAAVMGTDVLESARNLASARIDVYLTHLHARMLPTQQNRVLVELREELDHLRALRNARWPQKGGR